MKPLKISKFLVLALATTIAATACKKTPTKLTVLREGPRLGEGKPVPGDTGEPKAARGKDGPELGPGPRIDRVPFGPGDRPPGPGIGGTNLPTIEPAKTNAMPDITQAGPFEGTDDRTTLQADSVYFDFDSSVVRAAERPKLAAVAEHMKSNATKLVRIEGNCDERGTEEYNRSLGERRALSLREHLIALGIEPSRIETVSFGKDKPRGQGHDETAWAENRRGDFVVVTPTAK